MPRFFSVLAVISLIFSAPSSMAIADDSFSGVESVSDQVFLDGFDPTSNHCDPNVPRANRVFFDGDRSLFGGSDGSYASPYSNLQQLEILLTGDEGSGLATYDHENVRYVCFTGTFGRDVYINEIVYADLYFGSYGGGAILSSIDINYGLYTLSSNLLETLLVEDLFFERLSVSDIDEFEIYDSEIGDQGLTSTGTDYVTVDSVDLNSQVSIYEVDQVELTNLSVSGFPYYAVYVGQANFLDFHDNHDLTYDVSGLSILDVSYSKIYRNTFDGNEGEGSHAIEFVETFGTSTPENTNAHIYNNFFLGHNSVAVLPYFTESLELVNNSFYDNGYAYAPHARFNTIRNNIFDSKGGHYTYAFTTPFDPSAISSYFDIYANNNIYWGDVIRNYWSEYQEEYGYVIDFTEWVDLIGEFDSLEADPLFISSTDLHLQIGSPAIDAGTNTPSYYLPFSTDFDSEYRKIWDIGADEKH